jgi:hypothetical protein
MKAWWDSYTKITSIFDCVIGINEKDIQTYNPDPPIQVTEIVFIVETTTVRPICHIENMIVISCIVGFIVAIGCVTIHKCAKNNNSNSPQPFY